MKKSDYCLIITTIDDKKVAKNIINTLLNRRLVACVQLSHIDSFYHWQGDLEESKEILLNFKTKKSLFEIVKREIENLHTYDIPEIIMVDIKRANDSYIEWMEKELIQN